MSSAGAIEVLGAMGGVGITATGIWQAVRWLIREGERRAASAAASREAKLSRWHSELDTRERRIEGKEDDYLARIEATMEKFQGELDQRSKENQALRLAFELVAGALRAMDPMNSALRRAEQLLATSFPLDPIIPPNIAEQLGRVDVADKEYRA